MGVILSILGFAKGRSWLMVGAVGIAAFLAGSTISWQLRGRLADSQIAQVQHELDEYRLEVSDSVNAGNQRVIESFRRSTVELNKLLTINRQLTQEQTKSSDLLIERLKNAEVKSCELSPNTIEYLNSVRKQQSTTPDPN